MSATAFAQAAERGRCVKALNVNIEPKRVTQLAPIEGAVIPPLGVVKEEVAVQIVLVRNGAAVRRAMGDEVPGAVEEETGPAAVRRVPPGLQDGLPVHALDWCVVFLFSILLFVFISPPSPSPLLSYT